MDFDPLLTRFFGTADIDTLDEDGLVSGVNRLRVQFGLERDGDKRFELWCLMYLLGVAPEADEVFKDEADRAAARDFMIDADRELDAD
jgi:hypothetical protein